MKRGKCKNDYQWQAIPESLYTPGSKDPDTGHWIKDFDAPKHTLIRVLYLRDRKDYISRSYRYFYDEVEVASKNPSLDVRLWGPGFFGYEESLSLQANIEQTFGKEDFFNIIYTSAFLLPDVKFTQNTVFVYSLGDCHENRCGYVTRILTKTGTRFGQTWTSLHFDTHLSPWTCFDTSRWWSYVKHLRSANSAQGLLHSGFP
jgi:hypothetical protein